MLKFNSIVNIAPIQNIEMDHLLFCHSGFTYIALRFQLVRVNEKVQVHVL